MVVAHMNGDGKADLVRADASNVIVQLGNGDGTFRPRRSYPLNSFEPFDLTVADFNRIGKTGKYLYRAVDKEAQTNKFVLSAERDVAAAKRFFKKLPRADSHYSQELDGFMCCSVVNTSGQEATP